MRKTKGKKAKYYFRLTRIWDGTIERAIYVDRNKMWFGIHPFTKEELRAALKRGRGRFKCVWPYSWRLTKDGRITFRRYKRQLGALQKSLVDRIRRWAHST